MNTALLISVISIAVAIVSLLVSIKDSFNTVKNNNRIHTTTLLLDFSKRYQDIMLAMPEDETKKKKFILLYFDLCSEEFRLHQKSEEEKDGLIDKKTWNLWVEGMEIAMKNPLYKAIWRNHRKDYASENAKFQKFFDRISNYQE